MAPPIAQDSASDTRVLVVGPAPETVALLKGAGIDTEAAPASNAALDRARAWRPDLVLVEPDAPDFPCVQFVAALKSDPRLAGVFVVFLAAPAVPAERLVPLLDAGADGSVRRPVSDTELLACIRVFLRQKRTADSLRDTRRLLETAQRIAQVGSWQRHFGDNRLVWSEEIYRIFGVDPDAPTEAGSDAFFSRVHPDDRDQLLAARERALRGDGPLDLEHRIVRPDGDVRHVHERAVLIKDPSGRAVALAGTVQDITSRKRLEQEVLRARRSESIGTLATGIAHDLNGILSPILLGLGLLDTELTEPRARQILDTIADCARRGVDLVNQVLSVARGVPGRRIEVRLDRLIRDIQRTAREACPSSVAIHAVLDPNPWSVLGDPAQLHQVLLHLCLNARDAMPEGGRLHLRVRNTDIDAAYAAMNLDARTGPHVVVEVEDTGTGIATADLDRVFEPFFTTKEIGAGTGLGLSLALAIVKSHGGFIRVYSDRDIGTRFRVYLPAHLSPSADAPGSTRFEPLPQGNGETILVVDDEPIIRQVTAQTLQAFGYRVLTAANGAEGVSLFAQQSPSSIALVLTDMMMPVMDGPAMIQVLRRIHPAVRVIAASGITGGENVDRANAVGVQHFLAKPYSAETLLTVLRNVLTAGHPPAQA
ncbi:MAG: response regulator [Verrucomicrobiae bacterium]|nr:response regulator [Verrucomicrobiae bacterium]